MEDLMQGIVECSEVEILEVIILILVAKQMLQVSPEVLIQEDSKRQLLSMISPPDYIICIQFDTADSGHEDLRKNKGCLFVILS
mmetsp:Transcript_9807/g.18448  ORF Transcript_9807/g.18448 Transcript_9807/m.18448 type:complete len:84 (-) Transcript_9807:283-534(-)